MPVQFTFRRNTQDLDVYLRVCRDNEYGLPDSLAGVTVLDIGAHIGAFALACLDRGAARVLCVEPDPDNYDLLRRNLAPHWSRAEARNLALWDGPGEPELCQLSGGRTAMSHCLGVGCGLPVGKATLAELVGNFPRGVGLLKLDCEGAEWPALGEARDLSAVRVVVGEGHPAMRREGWERYGLTRSGMESMLLSHGFKAHVGDMPGHDPEFVFRFEGTR